MKTEYEKSKKAFTEAFEEHCEKKISELIKSSELYYADHVKRLQADRDEILKENALLEARVKELENKSSFLYIVN